MAALKMPLEFKTHGRFQGDLINRIHPKLASYSSDYGYPFDKPVPFMKKIKNNTTIYRPVWLRRNSYAIQHKFKKPELPEALSDKYIVAAILSGNSLMAQYFDFSEIRDPALYSRILILDYLFKHIGL